MAAIPTTTNAPAPGTPGGADPAMVGVGNQNPNRPDAAVVPAVSPIQNQVPTPVSSVPSPTPPGAVVTSAPAVADVTGKMSTVNGLAATQKPPQVPMATLINATTGDRKAVAVGSQDAQQLFGQGYVLEQKGSTATPAPKPNAPADNTGAAAAGQPTGLTPLPTAPTAPDAATQGAQIASDYEAQSQANIDKSNAAYQQYQTSLTQLQNGTFPLTPVQQAQLNNITTQYQQLMDQQKVTNQNYTSAVKLAGIRAGRNMYAPEIDLGNVNAAISKGTQEIGKIQLQMSQAITTAQTAFQDNDLKLLNSSYDALTKNIDDQQKVTDSMYSAAKDALTAAQTQFTNDMATANFNLDVAKELNAPILAADAKLKDTLYAAITAHPDAGVLPSDTVQQASDKVTNSASFKAAQAQTAADLEKTKAETNQANAAAQKDLADAVSASGAGTDAVNSAQVRTINGKQYLNAADFPDAKSMNAAQQWAASQNPPVTWLNKAEGEDMVKVSSAFDTLNDIAAQVDGHLGGGASGGIVGMENSVSGAFGNPDIRGYQTNTTAAITALKALIGSGSGLRITKGEIQMMQDNIPIITGPNADNAESATRKLNLLKNQMNNIVKENLAKGTDAAVSSSQEGATKNYNGTTYKVVNGNWVAQ